MNPNRPRPPAWFERTADNPALEVREPYTVVDDEHLGLDSQMRPAAVEMPVILRAFCEQCRAERRPGGPDRIGELHSSDGTINGDVIWWGNRDPRARTVARLRPDRAERFLKQVTNFWQLRSPHVAEYRLWNAHVGGICRRHGRGDLDTAEILRAALRAPTGRVANVVLPLQRT